MQCSIEEQWRLKCDHLENQAWRNIQEYKILLEEALRTNTPHSMEENIVYAAAHVAFMHMIFAEAQDKYFGLEPVEIESEKEE